jgi:RNA polymerase sigma factor (sigma-70 family)
MNPPAEGFASRLILGPALRAQSDHRLVTLVRDGYETAFEEIVRRYGRPLTRYAAAIVGGRSEDVTQDAFSKALLALRHNETEIELRPWLFRIVRNTALNDLRDRPPSAEVLVEALAGGRNPVEELEQREELVDLIARLQALPEPQRAAIVMRELEGLSHDEIAAALGTTGGGARQAIHRARTALRDTLGAAIPLPLLQALIDHGAGTAAGGAVAGAGATIGGGAAGAGGALKLGLATALIAGSVGTGLVLNNARHGLDATAATPASASASERAANSTLKPGDSGREADGNSKAGYDDHGGRGGRGEDDSHTGAGQGLAGSSGPGPQDRSDHDGLESHDSPKAESDTEGHPGADSGDSHAGDQSGSGSDSEDPSGTDGDSGSSTGSSGGSGDSSISRQSSDSGESLSGGDGSSTADGSSGDGSSGSGDSVMDSSSGSGSGSSQSDGIDLEAFEIDG